MSTTDAPPLSRPYPTGAFRRIGWAFLFLSISVGPTVHIARENFLIDVLPDFIGFLMIATAAHQLVRLHPLARSISNLALLLTFLTVSTIVQYTVVTSQSGGIATWRSPLWPLFVVQGLFELVLVWNLCGLVAALAERAGLEVVRQRALTQRALYIFLRLLVIGFIVLVLFGPNRDLIVGGAIVVVVIGLVLLAMMMGLMWQAERMCECYPEVAGPPTATNEPRGDLRFRLLFTGALIFPLALAIASIWYYLEWKELRNEEGRKSSSSNYFSPARDEFREHLRAGRLDEAYEATTADFKSRISRGQLDELARQYKAFEQRAEQHRGGGAGSSSGNDYLTEYRYIQLPDDRIVQATITIRRDRDSILFRKPPPPKVDDFSIEEKTVSQRPGLFGQPPRPQP